MSRRLPAAGIARDRRRAARTRRRRRERGRRPHRRRRGRRRHPDRRPIHRPRQPARRDARPARLRPRPLDRLNLVDEAVTLGTLPELRDRRAAPDGGDGQDHPLRRAARRGRRAAPRSPPKAARCCASRRSAAKAVALIQTRLPGLKESILDKTREVTAAGSTRSAAGSCVSDRCAHTAGDLAARDRGGARRRGRHGADARRLGDPRPARRDPGGDRRRRRRRSSISACRSTPATCCCSAASAASRCSGLPGCARSPKVNGFDWVLERLVADVPVGARGHHADRAPAGLLAEIPTRPQPRAGRRGQTRPQAVSQGRASPRCCSPPGKSSRMGSNKMLAEIDGRPMVARVAQRLLSSHARPVVAVLGNQADQVDAALGTIAGRAGAQSRISPTDCRPR